MGCGNTTPQNVHHAEIEHYLNMHHKADKEIKKLLLLGDRSGGKAAFLKQMDNLYGSHVMTQFELHKYIHKIRENIVKTVIFLLKKSEDFVFYSYDDGNKYKVDVDNQEICSAIRLIGDFGTEFTECKVPFSSIESLICGYIKNAETQLKNHIIPNEIYYLCHQYHSFHYGRMKALGQAIKLVWNLDAIQQTAKHRAVLPELPDYINDFLPNAEQICCDDYEPSFEDILKVKVEKTGIIERCYEIRDTLYHIIDVDGQRNERKKWIHLFEGNMNAVLFFAPLNTYNKTLYDDDGPNAMHVNIELFIEICNSKWFRKSAMIILLYKESLFERMLAKEYPLSRCFSFEYGWTGDQWLEFHSDYEPHPYDWERNDQDFVHCLEQSIRFIKQQYKNQNMFPNKKVMAEVINVRNQVSVEKVFRSIENFTS